MAQRARNKTQVKTIHAKIANHRKDALHKFSRKLVNRCGEIYVGNVSSLKLVRVETVRA
ncbi:transposase [Denitrificimonas halotolerans]|uniref:transposase n=1 Tax=Denitrificimonas halotolerans TaxID=3098930 RepID=UPI0038995AAA